MQHLSPRHAANIVDVLYRLAGKRLIDVVLSAGALIVLAPLLGAIVLLIRLDSPGPALFRQKRVGKDGRLFTCYKFRTMWQHADETVHRAAYQQFVVGEALSDDPHYHFKLANDSRVTSFGKILRRTSLDELPQLLNILLGDMSVVGPRPAIPYELEHYEAWHHQRYQVKPGLTGLWQVYGRSTIGFTEMMLLDIQYVNTWSLWLDIKLIFLTVPVLLQQQGAC